jgi:hypothetical protein
MATGRGLGVGGRPRQGRRKTNAERLREHERRTGSNKLPPRGTGLKRKKKK